MDLNNKQRKTLELIFTDPIPANILWNNIESLFVALGADVSQGKGSRVRVKLNEIKAVFHPYGFGSHSWGKPPRPCYLTNHIQKKKLIKEPLNLLENF